MTPIVILAALLCGTPQPAAASPDTASPGWVWISNEGRYGWGRITAGYFRPEPGPEIKPDTRPDQPEAGAFPTGGVDAFSLHATAPNTFTTNDPHFRPNGSHIGQQSPLPINDPSAPRGEPPNSIFIGACVISGSMILAAIFLPRRPPRP